MHNEPIRKSIDERVDVIRKHLSIIFFTDFKCLALFFFTWKCIIFRLTNNFWYLISLILFANRNPWSYIALSYTFLASHVTVTDIEILHGSNVVSFIFIYMHFLVGSVLLIFLIFCIMLCFCFVVFVCLRSVSCVPKLPMSVNYPFLIAPLVLSNVYLITFKPKTKEVMSIWLVNKHQYKRTAFGRSKEREFI